MMWIGGGTTIERYEEFMNVILDDLNQNYAVDGAIEYVFNTIQTMLQMFYHQVDTMEHLEQKIIEIIASIDSFRSYFVHVGFR